MPAHHTGAPARPCIMPITYRATPTTAISTPRVRAPSRVRSAASTTTAASIDPVTSVVSPEEIPE